MKKNKNTNIYLMLFKVNKGFLKEIFFHHKFFCLVMLIDCIFSGLSISVYSYVPKYFLDSIVNEGRLDKALWSVAFSILFSLILGALYNIKTIYSDYTFTKVILKEKTKIIEKLNRMYMEYFDDAESRDIVNRAIQYPDRGGRALTEFIFNQISMLITVFTMTLLFMQLDWWFFIILVAQFIIRTLIMKKTNKISYQYNIEQQNISRRYNYFFNIFNAKHNLEDIKLNNSMNYFLDKFREIFKKNIKIQTKFKIKTFALNEISTVFYYIFHFISYLYIGIKLLTKAISVGDFTMFFNLVDNLNGVVYGFMQAYSSFYSQALDAQNYYNFTENKKYFIDNEIKKINIASQKIDSIRFENVSFRYPGQIDFALKNVSFEIKKGEKVSVVGQNGAGKTTLIKLLLLFFGDYDGNIYINDIDIKKINYIDYWHKIGVVFQNHIEYSIPIEENIMFKKCNDSDKKKIWESLDIVGLKSKIEEFNLNISTPLTREFDENGIDLSGGERQKLSIARALARDSELLILDEPSSSLDPIAEYELFKTVKNLDKNKTVIFISHRLSSVISSDKIIVLNKGKIVEIGSHQELMKNSDFYSEMFNMQAENYREETA